MTVPKLLDAKSAEELKLWADKVYEALLSTTGSGSVIKSIQRGTVQITGTNTTGTATVTAVVMANSELREVGQTVSTGSAGSLAYIVLTNTTTITATRASASSGTTTVSWELTEYE